MPQSVRDDQTSSQDSEEERSDSDYLEDVVTGEEKDIKMTVEDLNYPLIWDNNKIKNLLTSSGFIDEDIKSIVHFYHKLRTSKLPKSKSSGQTTRTPNRIVDTRRDAKELVEAKISNLYAKFIQDKIGKSSSVDFLNFIKNRYLDPKSMINHYFDKIYVLNLDRRPDRMQNMEKRFKKWGIYNYVRWPAIDGIQSPHWEEWKHYTKSRMTRLEKVKYRRKAIASAGSWAILKSMYHLLVDAKRNEYKRILVLQDDNLFHKNFTEKFKEIQNYIPDKWSLLYLGGTQHSWTHIMKSKYYYHPCGTADGAFAVGIDHSLYDELIEEILKFEAPVDSGALRNLQKKYLYSSYVLYPNILIADIRDSDLRGSRDLYNFGKRFRWDINLYDID